MGIRQTLILAGIMLIHSIMPSIAVDNHKPNQFPFDIIKVPLTAWLASRPHASANSVIDFAIEPRTRERFAELIIAITKGDWKQAQNLAKIVGYEIVVLSEDDKQFLIIEEKFTSGFGPTIVIATNPSRNVVAEAPHATFEKGTSEEAAMLLLKLGFRAAIISGAHRCASQTFVKSVGSTHVCGDRSGLLSPYRTSDVAHNSQTLFHMAHATLSDLWHDATIISLHGMQKRGDVIAIVSSGSKATDNPKQKFVKLLRDNFRKQLNPNQGNIFSCNNSDDSKKNFPPLCGFTNAQAIYTNKNYTAESLFEYGNPSKYGKVAHETSGRFIHLEQTWDILGEFHREWNSINRTVYAQKLLNAFAAAFPEDIKK